MKDKQTVILCLPWAPSANEIWRSSNFRSRPYIAPKYKRFLRDVKTACVAQGSPRFEGKRPLEITIDLFPPHNRPYDVDNRIKPTLDALTKAGVWRDDRYVRRITANSNFSVEGGAIIVNISPLVRNWGEMFNAVKAFGLKILQPKLKGTTK